MFDYIRDFRFMRRKKKETDSEHDAACDSVLDLIGNTPLVRLDPQKLGFRDCEARILAKLEFTNPGGSVKDRIAIKMIEDAEKAGKISAGKTTLVEATSGNTGIALAMVAASKGYRLVVTMPRVQAITERYLLIRALGAEVYLSDPELKAKGFLDLAKKIANETPGSFLLSQFENESNPRAHQERTGPEIWQQTNGTVDVFVAGAGTGGTVVGVGRYLKSKSESVRVVCVEPGESRVLQGATHRVHALLGIGTGLQVPMIESLAPGAPFVPGPRGVVDEFASCSSADGLDMALRLATSHGILAGPTSGAVVHAALEVAMALPNNGRGRTIVALCASSSVRYLQHPMYELLRKEATQALSGEEEIETTPRFRRRSAALSAAGKRPQNREYLELAKCVESRILAHVRALLKNPALCASDNLIDHGADSLTAMMLLGQIRGLLVDIVPKRTGLSDLKLAILKERLWGSVHDLSLAVLGIDEDGHELPRDRQRRGGEGDAAGQKSAKTKIDGELTIQFCGG